MKLDSRDAKRKIEDSANRVECSHCGTPFNARNKDDEYCCEGCRYVSSLLEVGGYGRFYDLRGKDTLPPVGSRAFKNVDEDWLISAQSEAETQAPKMSVNRSFALEGISCIGCVWLIQAIYKARPGAVEIQIQPQQGRINLTWRKEVFDLVDFAQELQKLGYSLAQADQEEEPANKASKELVSRIGLCGFFLLNTMLFTLPGYLGMAGNFFLAPIFQILGATFATMAFICGGSYFIQRAYKAARNGVLHIDMPIAIGLTVAYAGSLIGWSTGYTKLVYFDFVATFVFLMLVGRWLQEVAIGKNRNFLKRQQVGPKDVTAIGGARDGEPIAISEVKSELEYSVAPGEINPVAADPLDTSASLSLEWINGEAEPVVWPKERTVPAGAINVGMTELRLKAREDWGSSMLAQLLERPSDDFQDERLQKILKYYISTVIMIAIAGGAAWFTATADLLKSFQVLISVLIVSCPCATGVALPLCNEFATSRLRKLGLFIKTPQIWERLRKVRTVVFDKTGTLTMDVPRLTDPESIRNLDLLSAQALHQLVDKNQHPIGRALREALLAGHPQLRHQAPSGKIEEFVGQGVTWTDSTGSLWSLGKFDWKPSAQEKTSHSRRSETALRQDGLIVATFDCIEDVRDDAKETVDFFRHQNLDTMLLSGDAPNRVDRIREQLGLTSEVALAQCSPSDKAEWIEANANGTALMIGDGANDSLAFDAAICRGTPVIDKSILESSSDFFFFGRSLRCLQELIHTAHIRRRTVTSVFVTAVAYNLIAIGLCLAGLMHPLLAAILMPLSSVATLAIAWGGLANRKA